MSAALCACEGFSETIYNEYKKQRALIKAQSNAHCAILTGNDSESITAFERCQLTATWKQAGLSAA